MRKLLPFALAITLFSAKTAFNQQFYRLHLNQPTPISITLDESINASVGTLVNLDTMFHVQGYNIYQYEWKFWDGVQMYALDNPVVTLSKNGVFYLTVTIKDGCKAIDSIAFDVTTGLNKNHSNPNQQSIKVFPNPNNGTFTIKISDCQPGFSLRIINILGVQLLSRVMDCNNNDYSGTITIPSGKPGIYYLQLENENKIIYRQKIILYNK